MADRIFSLGKRSTNPESTNSISSTASAGGTLYTVTLTNAPNSGTVVGDLLVDEAASPNDYLITAVSGNDLTVDDINSVGSAPDSSSTTQMEVKRAYSTLSSWEADWGNSSYYPSGDDGIGRMYADSDFDASGDYKNVFDVALATGVNSMTLTSADSGSNRHDGTEGTGAVINGGSSATGLTATTDNFGAEWIEMKMTGSTNANLAGFNLNSNESFIRNSIIHDIKVTSQSYRTCRGVVSSGVVADDNYCHNNIIYEIRNLGTSSSTGNKVAGVVKAINSDFWCQHNTIHDITVDASAGTNAHAFELTGDNDRIQNNIGMDGSTADYTFSGTKTANDYNMSSDTSATGTNSINNETTGEFVSVGASPDYHLASGADAIDEGTLLSSPPTGINTDIDGNTRSGSVDMGAHEYQSAGGATIPIFHRHYANLRAA